MEERILDFGNRIIQMSGVLSKFVESNIVRNQVTISGTSIGVNYREVNRSRSKADLANIIRISEGEASETI